MTDHVEQMQKEMQAIQQIIQIVQGLPTDAVRRRVLSYVRNKVVPPKKREPADVAAEQ